MILKLSSLFHWGPRKLFHLDIKYKRVFESQYKKNRLKAPHRMGDFQKKSIIHVIGKPKSLYKQQQQKILKKKF